MRGNRFGRHRHRPSRPPPPPPPTRQQGLIIDDDFVSERPVRHANPFRHGIKNYVEDPAPLVIDDDDDGGADSGFGFQSNPLPFTVFRNQLLEGGGSGGSGGTSTPSFSDFSSAVSGGTSPSSTPPFASVIGKNIGAGVGAGTGGQFGTRPPLFDESSESPFDGFQKLFQDRDEDQEVFYRDPPTSTRQPDFLTDNTLIEDEGNNDYAGFSLDDNSSIGGMKLFNSNPPTKHPMRDVFSKNVSLGKI